MTRSNVAWKLRKVHERVGGRWVGFGGFGGKTDVGKENGAFDDIHRFWHFHGNLGELLMSMSILFFGFVLETTDHRIVDACCFFYLQLVMHGCVLQNYEASTC